MEDWAEIRRLQRGEETPIKEIARRMGIAWDAGRTALRAQGQSRVGGTRLTRRWSRATDQATAVRVSADARDGDRRTDRLGTFADHTQ